MSLSFSFRSMYMSYTSIILYINIQNVQSWWAHCQPKFSKECAEKNEVWYMSYDNLWNSNTVFSYWKSGFVLKLINVVTMPKPTSYRIYLLLLRLLHLMWAAQQPSLSIISEQFLYCKSQALYVPMNTDSSLQSRANGWANFNHACRDKQIQNFRYRRAQPQSSQ